MQIYPAIDLYNGSCVRLYQGNFQQATHYFSDPLSVARSFEEQGATWLHIVDLNAAKGDLDTNSEIIKKLLNSTALKLQIGGGIRSEKQVENLLENRAARVVIGSQAIKDSTTVKTWFDRFCVDQLVLAIDIKFGIDGLAYAAIQGWQDLTDFELTTIVQDYQTVGVKHILCTDISRDGTLQGPNIDLYKNLRKQFPNIELQASGGIANIMDLKNLREANLSGSIIGRALYEKNFTLSEALTC